MKRIAAILLVAAALFTVFGCQSKSPQAVDPFKDVSLEDLLSSLYEGIDEEKLPKMIQTVMNQENVNWYLGTDEIDYEEALASEPMISAIAHSVCVVRMKEGADMEAAKQLIQDNVDRRKWICVDVDEENVIVDSAGSVIVLIMSDDHAANIHANFTKLAAA